MGKQVSGSAKKRQRINPIKRWTASETSAMLTYITKRKGQFEKPTAKIFYTDMVEKTKIDATSSLLRYKMKNLKATYIKAKEWRKSLGAGFGDDDLFVQQKIRKMCPYYKELCEIFQFDEKCAPKSCLQEMVKVEVKNNKEGDVSYHDPLELELAKEIVNVEMNRDFSYHNSLEVEKEKLELEKRKLDLEEVRIQNEFKIKARELKMKERIARYELDLKYNNQKM